MTVGEDGHGLANTINHLYGAHQVNPLVESLYLVTNACNHEEYGGVAGFFDDIGRFPREYGSNFAWLIAPEVSGPRMSRFVFLQVI